MKVLIENKPQIGNDEARSQIIVTPETNGEGAELRWMEEVFDLKQVQIIPRYLGGILSYAIIIENLKLSKREEKKKVHWKLRLLHDEVMGFLYDCALPVCLTVIIACLIMFIIFVAIGMFSTLWKF
jgi:hypothetical protein